MFTFSSDASNSASLMQKETARKASLLSKHRNYCTPFSNDCNEDVYANGEKFELQSQLFFDFSHFALLHRTAHRHQIGSIQPQECHDDH